MNQKTKQDLSTISTYFPGAVAGRRLLMENDRLCEIIASFCGPVREITPFFIFQHLSYPQKGKLNLCAQVILPYCGWSIPRVFECLSCAWDYSIPDFIFSPAWAQCGTCARSVWTGTRRFEVIPFDVYTSALLSAPKLDNQQARTWWLHRFGFRGELLSVGSPITSCKNPPHTHVFQCL